MLYLRTHSSNILLSTLPYICTYTAARVHILSSICRSWTNSNEVAMDLYPVLEFHLWEGSTDEIDSNVCKTEPFKCTMHILCCLPVSWGIQLKAWSCMMLQCTEATCLQAVCHVLLVSLEMCAFRVVLIVGIVHHCTSLACSNMIFFDALMCACQWMITNTASVDNRSQTAL